MNQKVLKQVLFVAGFVVIGNQINASYSQAELANLSTDDKVALTIKEYESAVEQGFVKYESIQLAHFITRISSNMKFAEQVPVDNSLHLKILDAAIKLFIKKEWNIHQEFNFIELPGFCFFSEKEKIELLKKFSNKSPYKTLMHLAINVDSSVVQVLIDNGFKVDQEEELDVLCFAQECNYNREQAKAKHAAYYDDLDKEIAKQQKQHQEFLDKCCFDAFKLFFKQCHVEAQQKFLKKYPEFKNTLLTK